MDIRFPQRLTEHLKTLAPIDGVKIRDPLNRATWSIRFGAGATASQIAAAEAAKLTFDIPANEDEDVDAPTFTKRELAIIRTIALASNKTLPQIKQLFRQAWQSLP